MIRTTLLALLFAAACTKVPEKPAPPAPPVDAVRSTLEKVQGTEPAEDVKPVYAGNPAADPKAKAICDLVATLPLERQAACCKLQKPQPTLASECTRVVTVALRDGHAKLDDAKWTACQAAYEKELGDCDRVLSRVTPMPEACAGLFTGDVPLGGLCRSALECQKGLFCAELGPTQSGKCSMPEPNGSPCHTIVDPLAVYTKQDLPDHPACTGDCNRNHCEDVRATGGECTFDAQCGPKGHCFDKKCAAGGPIAVGGRCDAKSECVLDATCKAGACTLRGATGASCASTDDCLGECDEGHCAPVCPHPFVPRFSQPRK